MRVLIGLVCLLGLGLGSSAAARPPGPPPPPSRVLLDQAEPLGLSADEVRAIEAVGAALEEVGRAAHAAMRAARDADDAPAIARAERELDAAREAFDAELEAILGAERWSEIRAALPPPPRGAGPGPEAPDRPADDRPAREARRAADVDA